MNLKLGSYHSKVEICLLISCATWAQHNMFFSLHVHVCKRACTRKVDDIKPIVQNS